MDRPAACTNAAAVLVEHLSPDRLRVAYPLVRHALPEVALENWVRFARRLTRPSALSSAGVVLARRACQRFPSGVACWRRDRDLRRGLVLTAELLVAVDILDPAPALAALLREMDAIADRLGCAAVRVSVPPGLQGAALRGLLTGHDATTMVVKTLPPRRVPLAPTSGRD